jgi:dTMP kinase
MPFHASLKLKKIRKKELDEHEKSKSHLLKAERAYIELADKYGWKTIECAVNEEPRTIDDISDEIYKCVTEEFKLVK